MDAKAVGARIKKAREAASLTQEQLAEMVGLSSSHISVVERGVKAPRLETLVAIANALGVTADSLLIDVLDHAMEISASELSEQIKRLSPKAQEKTLKVIQVLVECESED